nr:hypothetical protein [Tanacetum cinerariifolium]
MILCLLNVGPTDGRKALETELTQLKDTITTLRIQNDGFKVTNATQKTEIAKLKAKDVGNKSSGTTTPITPRVFGSLTPKALETELTQLKDTITALRIQNDGFKVTNATQKTEIAKLKAKDVGNKSS